MSLYSVILSSILEVVEAIAKPLNQEEDEGANSFVTKVDHVLDDVEAKEDDASKEDEDEASEEDNVEEASASDVDNASEADIALVLGGMKTLIEDDALVLGVKKYNQSKVDADLGPILKARTPDSLATRFNKRPREAIIGKTSAGLASRYTKRLKEGTIVADELENFVAEIKAKIKAKDKAFSSMMGRNVFKHLKPFLAEAMGGRLKNISGKDADEINAFEETFIICFSRIVVKHLTPCLAEVLEECRPRQG